MKGFMGPGGPLAIALAIANKFLALDTVFGWFNLPSPC
jgi:hypothetical protein